MPERMPSAACQLLTWRLKFSMKIHRAFSKDEITALQWKTLSSSLFRCIVCKTLKKQTLKVLRRTIMMIINFSRFGGGHSQA